MIGEWLLLPPANLEEAKTHFATALKGGKAKPFVRGCQLEGMIYNEEPGVRAELIRVANQMRKDNDPISDDDKGRIHSYFSTTVGTDAELREVVSAAPPDEVWAMSGSVLRPPRHRTSTRWKRALFRPASTRSPAKGRTLSRFTGVWTRN